MRLLCVMLCLVGTPSLASPTSDVSDAQVALEQGEAERAVVLLQRALANPDAFKKRGKALATVLLGEAMVLASPADEGERAARDRLLGALRAAHDVTLLPDVPQTLLDRAQAVALDARRGLWDQAITQIDGEEPSSAMSWASGMEAVEGESLETLALRAMVLSHAGKRAEATAAFEAATRTADQPGSDIRTPRWGLTYRAYARLILAKASDHDGLIAALSVIERGLAWRVRSTDTLGKRFDYDLRFVRRALDAERLEVLKRLPERRTEALYALEAWLKDNQGNMAVLLEQAVWLEQHFPGRALDTYREAQQQRPQQLELARRLGALSLRLAVNLREEMRAATDEDSRMALRRKHEEMLLGARSQLERAHALAPDDRQIVQDVGEVCRRLGDHAAASQWWARARAMPGG